MSRAGRIAVIVVAVLIAAGCSDRLEGKFGEELYQEGCAHCHGVDLTGGTGPDIGPGSNADVGLSDQQIGDVIRVGPGAMPRFGGRLTDGQIDSLVEYLRVVQRGPGSG
jgi:mono/diheme cytochrome c family protein